MKCCRTFINLYIRERVLRMKYVITIARQFGSLGRPIAKKLAEILEVDYHDRYLIDSVAEKISMPTSIVSNLDEKANGKYFSMKFPLGMSQASTQNKIFEAQSEIIRDLASRESCIIVGRCADYILRDMKNHMRVYIYAPYETRLKNCTETLLIPEKDAKKIIREVDSARDEFHMKYAGYVPSNPYYKDIMLNSEYLGVDGTAQLLADIVKSQYISGR